jgi:hypothetical protein
MRAFTVAVCVALVAALVPASALAALRPIRPIPPSNPAANQYVESVPTAGGAKPSTSLSLHPGPSRSGSVPGTPTGGGAVPASTGRALVKSGTTGLKAAIFAQATAPKSLAHRKLPAGAKPVSPGGGSGASGSASSQTNQTASSPDMAVVRSVTGLDGVGAALPLILIVLAAAISGLAIYRRATH